MKIDLNEVASQAGGSSRFSDPAASFAYTEGISEKDVEKVGPETVDGTRTTHYKVTVDIGALARGGDEEQTEQLEKQLGESLPMDIWLDEQGRIRRQRTELSITPNGAGGQKATSTTTLRFSDFGTEVDVQAPAEKDTADVTDKILAQQEEQAAQAG